jgi:flagellar FliL protein
MAKKEEVQEESAEPKKGKGLIIGLIVVVVLLIVAVAVLAFMFMGSAKDDEGDAHGAEHYKPIDKGVTYSPSYRQFVPPPPGSPPQYFDMEQFVTNFKGEGKAKHLAVKIKLMTYYPELTAVLAELKPLVVDKVLANLRRKTYTELSQDDAQEVLAAEILQTIRAVLDGQKIYPETLDQVLVERFVMQ